MACGLSSVQSCWFGCLGRRSYWRRGHAAMMQAEESGRYGARSVWAHAPGRREIARGEPVRDGWLRSKVDDAIIGSWSARACLRSSLLTGGLRRSWVSSSSTAADRESWRADGRR